ncbi:putative secretory pathway protein sec39 protein [Eutypa lata UCREL1]|uniref:Putative secretory pathway protein sec39 protein n=1 Tax=Eutypa lata (strain UCR-EL1) TaxID=1287681 RepID=M7TKZ7_EUTLA|nr:putative secretory pathway protein sec39 protein [Eutypa lata UCREL1]
MSALLSPPRLVLLAVHLATKSDIDSLTALASQHSTVLHKELLLRILLTCLPETLPSSEYVSLVERIESGQLEDGHESLEVDWSSVQDFTDEEAARKVRKLKLLRLAWKDAPEEALDDPVTLFLIHRAHRVDEEAGLLSQLPELIVPFLEHAPCIRTWMVSALLPLFRRNYEYYPNEPIAHTLSAFERLDDRTAASLLLSQTGVREEDIGWLIKFSVRVGNRVAVKAIEEWDGPSDVDWAEYGSMWLGDEEQGYLERRYARAVLAAAYLIPESSVEALSGVNSIITKVMSLLDQDPCPTLQVASSLLPPFVEFNDDHILCAKNTTYMRNDLLEESNPLTTPTEMTTRLLHTITLSAFILTKGGAPCTVRRAGELAFLQDEREQKAEASRFILALSNKGPKSDDKYWIRARNELLWLRDWGAEESWESTNVQAQGVFGQLNKEFLEVECLKAFLSNTRTNIADAGLGIRNTSTLTPEQTTASRALLAERRIAAMCIDAALTEDDFETAYSYVVNRVASATDFASKNGGGTIPPLADDYSWKAALQAGNYRRTAQTLRPTHLGTASGNLEVRHLEQRIECLSAALRIAPAATLHDILKMFRKCEEALNAAVAAEEAQESAWDDRGDMQAMPGAFSSTVPAGVVRGGGGPVNKSARHGGDDAPMSLFDLSRASMARAQRNFTALSSLQQSKSENADDDGDIHGDDSAQRTRKRDQLREAAVGTLASGVGWLIGAQPFDRNA